MDFVTASWKCRILFSFVKRPWNGYNKMMMTLSTKWIYVTIPNIVNIKILKDSVRYVSLQAGNLTAHQCWAQTNYCEYGRQSRFFEGRIAMTFSIQNMLEMNTLPLAIFLPPVVNTSAFIWWLQREKDILALGFGPGWFQKIVLWIGWKQQCCNSHGVTNDFA